MKRRNVKEVLDWEWWKLSLAWRNFWADESGVGVVELILILVVLIGLVLIFKSQLTTIVNNIFDKITKQSGKV